MYRWFTGRGAKEPAIRQALDTLEPAIWQPLLAAHPFLRGLSPQADDALRQRTAWILASKAFHGAHGLPVTDAMRHSIAVQAALPILGLDTSLYHGWTQIIVYPGGFLTPRIEIDDAGVVHEHVLETSGESWEGGPVILSWEDICTDDHATANVVIHEFAHKLDQRAGGADGMPGLRAHRELDPGRWQQVLEQTFDDFSAWVEQVESAIPAYVDPESEAASPWYDALPLDPYAAQDPAEFFAVSSERFFIAPQAMAQAWPDWYQLLKQYYRQDPLQRLDAAAPDSGAQSC